MLAAPTKLEGVAQDGGKGEVGDGGVVALDVVHLGEHLEPPHQLLVHWHTSFVETNENIIFLKQLNAFVLKILPDVEPVYNPL